jgi:hypothetical protein
MTNQYHNLLCRSALTYAVKYNLPIFPSSRQKIPLIADWYHQASRDPLVIKGWWRKWPDANISMPTGSASGIIALDVDVKNGQLGFDSLRELEIKYGDLPKTFATISPSGGQHFYFKYNGTPLGRRIKFMPGLDLMAEDSQVLLPPSIGNNGKKYEWEVTGHISEVNLATPPAWLTKLVSNSVNLESPTTRGASFWRTLVTEGAKEGQRNQSVAQLAGYLFYHDIDSHVTLECVRLWNNNRNSPPLPDNEIVKTVNSIAGKEFLRRQGGRHV